MTKYSNIQIGTGPGAPASEVTFAEVEVSGTARMAQANVSGSGTFTGVVQVGDGNQRGTAVLTQSVTISSSASGQSGIRLPANSRILDIIMHVYVSASGNTGGMNVRVGTSGDGDQFADILTSAAGIYRVGGPGNVLVAAASGKAWDNAGASAQSIFVDVTAATSTTQTDKYAGRLDILYIPR